MSRLIPLILVLAAGLCFFAGYTVGKKHGLYSRSTPPARVEAASAEPAPAAEAVEIEVATPTETAPEPIPEVSSIPQVPDPVLLSKRAQKRVITLTDTQDRSIQAEVLDVTESHLKVRRQSDLRVVQVPVNMLCAEDRAFAQYLWDEKNPRKEIGPDTQMILDEIFGGF